MYLSPLQLVVLLLTQMVCGIRLYMANSLLTPTEIAKEGLMQLENAMGMGNLVHRQYKNEFVKKGDTVTIRKPVKFTVTDGATRSNQDVTEQSDTIVINKRKHVSWKFSTQDLTLTIQQMSERYIKPAAIVLANQIDSDLCALYKDLFWKAGTPGTTPNAFSLLGDMAEVLDNGAVPDDGQRCLVLDPAARWSMADALKTLNNDNMASDFVRRGRLGNIANFDVYGNQNIKKHTVGVATGTPLVNGASQTGASLVTDGWTNSTTGILLDGDQFTIAGVNSVNPVSKADTGQLQVFTVTADADSGATTGPATLSITPSITTSGAYQTVTASPADNAAITVIGTGGTAYSQNMAFHKNALALVTVPLELPESAGFKARVNHRGVSIRIVKDYDIDADEEIIRMDVLYGTKAIYPELGGRLWG